MILDLERFVAAERPFWTELEALLDGLEQNPFERMPVDRATRMYYLFQRSSADLAKTSALPGEGELHEYLETLVARAYAEIHESRSRAGRWSPWRWFTRQFPRTFRRHIAAFWLSLGVTLAGVVFGTLAISFDPASKPALMPFGALLEAPGVRVAREESAKTDRMAGVKSTFSAELMTHNTQVCTLTMALGATWGVGSAILLFYNGVTMGAVATDYIRAGYAQFLGGWLLPHGSVEIPAILLGGQAGFILAAALIGDRRRRSRRARLRAVAGDLVTLMGGIAVFLVWAGIIEAFFSQYHEPVVPYALKMAFGAAQLGAVILFLAKSGSAAQDES
jgi:uncharacterized membrane protein SpoIIM required for sporulation